MLNKHFREFIGLLEKHGVSYLVVGGYAVGYHGFPRYTGHLDIFIGINEENSRKIMEVFSEFGFSELGITENDFLEEEIVVEIGREPLKIQVLKQAAFIPTPTVAWSMELQGIFFSAPAE